MKILKLNYVKLNYNLFGKIIKKGLELREILNIRNSFGVTLYINM